MRWLKDFQRRIGPYLEEADCDGRSAECMVMIIHCSFTLSATDEFPSLMLQASDRKLPSFSDWCC